MLGCKISQIVRILTIAVAIDTRFVLISVIADLLPGNYVNIQKFLSWRLISVIILNICYFFYSTNTDTEVCSVFLLGDMAVIVYQEQATYQCIKRAGV